MMNKKSRLFWTLIVFAMTGIFFVSCNEQTPPGLDLGDGPKAADSSYVAAVEPKQDKVIFIEELTGVDCSNCPKAYQSIKSMVAANPDRILSVGLHPPSSGFTEPIFGKSKFDFRHDKVDEIITKLGGLTGGLPSGSINRVPLSTGSMFDSDYNAWISRVTPLLSQTTPVNMSMESVYNADKNTCEVVTKVAFTEAVSNELYLTIYVVEDDIKDYQNDGGFKDPDYKHQHVFRECITPIAGTSLNFADKNAGTVLQKRIEFTPNIEGDNAWNLDNCHIIAFVHKSGTDQSIVHALDVKMK